MSEPDRQLVEESRRGTPLPRSGTFDDVGVATGHADEDVWVGKALAREERLTRFLSYGSLFFGVVAPVIGVGALIVKFVQG